MVIKIQDCPNYNRKLLIENGYTPVGRFSKNRIHFFRNQYSMFGDIQTIKRELYFRVNPCMAVLMRTRRNILEEAINSMKVFPITKNVFA